MKIVQLTTDAREAYDEYGLLKPYFGTAPQALLEGFAQLPDVEIHVVSCSKQRMNSPEKIAQNIWFHQPVVGKWGWGRTLFAGCIKATREVIKRIQPDIVHGQGTERDCAISAVHSGFSNVITIHGNMAELQRLGYHGQRIYGAIASILENHALARSSGVFCNSAYTEDLVRPRSQKTWRVSNPIREVFFQPPTQQCMTDVPYLLNVGLVCPRKQQLEILQSMRHLSRAGYMFRILFAGGLAEETEYGKHFIQELKVAEKEGIAEHVGFLNEQQLVELMDRCSGFVHFPREEAFGLVVAEAMARGLKFFGSKVGGIQDITRNIEGAVTYNSFEGLEIGIENWLKAGAPRAHHAAHKMLVRYHPKVIAQRHLDIYRELIG